MISLIDSHAHLNDRRLAGDIDGAISRAAAEGVDRIICAGYDLASSRLGVAIASERENVWATVGIHPHDAKTLDMKMFADITTLAGQPTVVAIGEIGLDYHYDHSPRPVQKEAFRRQLGLAKSLDMPVVIHNREAGQDLMEILQNEGMPRAGGVMHCFAEDAEYALKVIELGLYIGIAGTVTFKKADALRDVVRTVPLDRMLIETDAPYLTPEPFRGRRMNEPALVRLVAEKIAEVRGITLEAVAEATTANTLRVFQGMRAD